MLKFPFWFNFQNYKKQHSCADTQGSFVWQNKLILRLVYKSSNLCSRTFTLNKDFKSRWWVFIFPIYNNTYSLPFAKNPSPPCIQICLSGKFMLRDIPCKYSAHEFTFSSIFGLAEKCRGRKDGNILGRAGVWTTINNAALRPKKVKRHWMMVRLGCW